MRIVRKLTGWLDGEAGESHTVLHSRATIVI